MSDLRFQVLSLEGELTDLHALLEQLAVGVEGPDASRAIMVVSRVVLRIAERADAISTLMISDNVR